MLESKKTSLVRSLLQQEIQILKEKSPKSPYNSQEIQESPRRSKQEPPKYFIGKNNPKGVSVYSQPLPPSPKYKTLAFISYSGKTTFYESEKNLASKPKRMIKKLSDLAKSGQLEEYIDSIRK